MRNVYIAEAALSCAFKMKLLTLTELRNTCSGQLQLNIHISRILYPQHCLESFNNQTSKFRKSQQYIVIISMPICVLRARMHDLTYDTVKVHTRSGPNLNICIFYNPNFFYLYLRLKCDVFTIYRCENSGCLKIMPKNN